ncbi:hypothetical protein SAMD00019534_032960 [Acytostelium subglobosum LB1]|uniref:hypothetical protein n=1 Tax=Acytostelium subglobosum LB1 TaxID=1410327 RepID=UPI000644E360|nr:hypothetical protein SAMD00019534_032960 [Acytostelium subglobosum LB1]GAM20121.1 hypothetical protein SAMD00019534_032960 [Acytostelium subglobosum LB1]|eukprot:XP_012756883.1 hypothetical protein SAMD00019534_032960 [Acytostelium subglobosum LB1]
MNNNIDNDNDNDTKQYTANCPKHNKRIDMLCNDCNTIICNHCLALEHNGHKIVNVDIIRPLIAENKYDRFSTRLRHLWQQMNKLAMSYQLMNKSSIAVTDQFRVLHELLIAEEHRIKSPIIDEMRRTGDAINSLMEEMSHIVSLTNATAIAQGASANKSDTECNEAVDMDHISQSINSSESMEQFISRSLGNQSINVNTFNDIELLNAVQQLERLAQKSSLTNLKPIRIRTSPTVLESIKQSIKSCFIDLNQCHLIFSHNETGCRMFDPRSTSTTLINYKRRISTYYAITYDGDYVYIFGGEESLNTYLRYSTIDLSYADLPMVGINGVCNVSTCFDGDKHIYLVGGTTNGLLSDCINRFNIITQQFSHFGTLPSPCSSSFVFIHEGKLYVIGGLKEKCHRKSILALDLNTLEWNTHTDELDLGTHGLSSCFDGKDIYVLTENKFIRVGLQSKEIKYLSPPPLDFKNNFNKLFFSLNHNEGLHLYLGNGKNWNYSRQLDNWTSLSDNYRSNEKNPNWLMLIDNVIAQSKEYSTHIV